jgi:hypothetical protein
MDKKLYTVITNRRINSGIGSNRIVESTRVEVPRDENDIFFYLQENYQIKDYDIVFLFHGWADHA